MFYWILPDGLLYNVGETFGRTKAPAGYIRPGTPRAKTTLWNEERPVPPRKPDLKQIDRIAREAGITDPLERRLFGEYIERCKRSGGYDLDANGNLSDADLRQIAQDFQDGMS